MPRRSDIAKTSAALLLIAPACFGGSVVEEKRVFCARTPGEEWHVQAYPPLTDIHKRQTIEEAWYSGTWLSSVMVRDDNEKYEFGVKYEFSQDGEMQKMTAHIKRWGRWTAEAQVDADENGHTTPRRIEYLIRGGTTTAQPEGSEEFRELFTTVPVYKTLAQVPCGARLNAEVLKLSANKK